MKMSQNAAEAENLICICRRQLQTSHACACTQNVKEQCCNASSIGTIHHCILLHNMATFYVNQKQLYRPINYILHMRKVQ